MLTRTDIYDFIASCKLGVLGTIGDDTKPQSALVGIAVSTELEIVFDTLDTSRKYRNLLVNPACSFVIGWAAEKTIQYQGDAVRLQSPELDRYLEVYFKVWPDCRAHLSWPGIVHFLVRPTWIRYSDFDQSPPVVQEFKF